MSEFQAMLDARRRLKFVMEWDKNHFAIQVAQMNFNIAEAHYNAAIAAEARSYDAAARRLAR